MKNKVDFAHFFVKPYDLTGVLFGMYKTGELVEGGDTENRARRHRTCLAPKHKKYKYTKLVGESFFLSRTIVFQIVFYLVIYFETGSCYVTQAALKSRSSASVSK